MNVITSDCLVFRVVESDNSPQKEDTDIFIIYDSYHSLYFLRGKRSDLPYRKMKDYSYEAYSLESVVQFLSLIIPKENRCSFELYSYSNLPKDKDNITFELLRTLMDPAKEVVAYINQYIRNKRLPKILSVISEITNDYIPDYVRDNSSNVEYTHDQCELEAWNAECDKYDWTGPQT